MKLRSWLFLGACGSCQFWKRRTDTTGTCWFNAGRAVYEGDACSEWRDRLSNRGDADAPAPPQMQEQASI